MKTNIKVSIIVPCYNVAPYLPRCLDSLVNQTLKEIEIICIDDKSTDDTLTILREYAKKDKRIKVIAQRKNCGVAVARNAGLDSAKGEYLGFVDPDDYVDTDFYEKLYTTALENGADIVKGMVKKVDLGGKQIIDSDLNMNISEQGKWHFAYQWVSGLYSSKMVKNNKIRFGNTLVGEDLVFLANCLKNSNTVKVCLDTFYNNIRRLGSLDSEIMPPLHIYSFIKAINMIADIYNSAQMSKDDYVYCIWQLQNRLLHFVGRNTSVVCKKLCMEQFLNLYRNCKYKYELEKKYLRRLPFIEHIQSEDLDGLVKYIVNQDNSTYTNFYKKIYLFGLIPWIKLVKKPKYIIVKIFGIQIIKIKTTTSDYRFYVFYIPIIRVKAK